MAQAKVVYNEQLSIVGHWEGLQITEGQNKAKEKKYTDKQNKQSSKFELFLFSFQLSCVPPTYCNSLTKFNSLTEFNKVKSCSPIDTLAHVKRRISTDLVLGLSNLDHLLDYARRARLSDEG